MWAREARIAFIGACAALWRLCAAAPQLPPQGQLPDPRLQSGRQTAPAPLPAAPLPAGLAGMVTLWLNEEWIALEVHTELGKAVARAYAKMRQQGALRA
jgi:hypothetical protein